MDIFRLSVPILDRLNKNIFFVDYFVEADSEPVLGDFLSLAKDLHEEKKCVSFYFLEDSFAKYCDEHMKSMDVILDVMKRYRLNESDKILGNGLLDKSNVFDSRLTVIHEGFDAIYLHASKVKVYKK